MKCIGIGLHTNRFTCCHLDEKESRRMKTYELSTTDIGSSYKQYMQIQAVF